MSSGSQLSSVSQHNNTSRSRSRERKKKRKEQEQKKKKSISHIKAIKIPTLDRTLVSFQDFIQNQTQNIDIDKAKEHHDKYKKKWIKKQNQIFFNEHYDEAWFQQKYNPIYFQRNEEEKFKQVHENAELFFNQISWSITEEVIYSNQKLFSIQAQDYDQEDHIQQNQILLKSGVNISESPFFGFDPDYLTIFIKPIKANPKRLSRYNIKEYMQKLPGFVSLSMSQPLKKQDFIRYAWVNFNNEENLNRALQVLSTFMIDNNTFSVIKSNSNRKKIRIIRMYPKHRIELDLKLTQKLIILFDKKYEVKNYIFSQLDKIGFTSSQQLDLNLLYLRRVHSYQYYCAQAYADQRMLATKCGLAHLRIEDTGPDYGIPNILDKAQVDSETLIKELEEFKPKFSLNSYIIEENSKLPEDQTKKQGCKCMTCLKRYVGPRLLASHVQIKHQEAKQKVCRCLICDKKFVDPKFLIKHFETKHNNFNEGRVFRCLHCKEKYQIEQEFLMHIESKHEQEKKRVISNLIFDRYVEDKNKITNYMRLQNQQVRVKKKRQKRSRKRNFYNDLDDPQFKSEVQNRPINSVNFLDI